MRGVECDRFGLEPESISNALARKAALLL